jgi:hypothetical protein
MSGHASAGPLRACVKIDDCLIRLLRAPFATESVHAIKLPNPISNKQS